MIYHTRCIECTKGTYWQGPNEKASCVNCSGVMEYSDVDGLTECKICSPGSIAYDYEMTYHTRCVECTKGTHWQGDSAKGSASCITCPGNTFTDLQGQTSCKECPQGTSANSEHTGCQISDEKRLYNVRTNS